MNEPLTEWGEAELAAEAAYEAAKDTRPLTEPQWHALADDMIAAAGLLEKLSRVIYGERDAAVIPWTAALLRSESIHVRAEGNTDE